MANVFQLFGELKVDSSQFSKGLTDADRRLEGTSKNLAKAEHRFKQLGPTTATQSRLVGSAMEAIKAHTQALGQRMSTFGRSLSIGITAPLIGAGVAMYRSAASFDDLRNKLQAATGGVTEANAKFKELFALAQKSPGVTTAFATEIYAMVKPFKLAEKNIIGLIQALGRIKMQNPEINMAQFTKNLRQMFGSGDLQDFKEALDQFPRFGEILGKKLGFEATDAKELKAALEKLKAAGKLTYEQFIDAFNQAVAADQSLGGLAETINTRFMKMMDRVAVAVEPIGKALAVPFESLVGAIVPIIERIGAVFTSLSPSMQTVVIGLGAIAAAVGPIAIGIGSVVSAIGSIAGAAPVIGLVGAAIAGLAVQMAPVIAIAAGWYAAWQTNFGGVRDLVSQVSTTIQTTWGEMTAAVTSLTRDMVAQVSKWWQENGEDIKRALTTISGAVRSIGGSIVEVWREYNGDIKAIVGPVWDAVKTLVTTALAQILNGIKLFAAVINGDWSKAWDATKSIIANVGRLWLATFGVIANAVIAAVKTMFLHIWKLGSWIYEEAGNLAENLALGFVNGLKNNTGLVRAAVTSLFTRDVTSLAMHILGEKSPSKVFFAIGKDVAQGFIDGINAMRTLVGESVREMLDFSTFFKGLTKADAPIVQLIGEMHREMAEASAVTEEMQMRIRLATAEFAKANPELKEYVLNLARIKDEQKALSETLKSGLDKYKDIFDEITEPKKKTRLEQLLETLKDSAVIAYLETFADRGAKAVATLAQLAEMKDRLDFVKRINAPGNVMESTTEPDVPGPDLTPKFEPWENFWGMMKRRLTEFKDSLPSFKQTLNDSLFGSFERVGDIFANAVTQWDGTLRGFFSSVAKGFQELAREIISQLIRIAVIKAALAIGNAIGGWFGGGSNPLGSGDLAGIDLQGNTFAKGGFTGHGGVKDIAGFVHGKEFVMPSEAVRHFGLSFMESIRNLQMPSLAPGFAGGGFTGGGFMPSMMAGNATSNTFNNQRSNVFNINVSGGGQNSARTADQIRREVIRGLHETEMRSK